MLFETRNWSHHNIVVGTSHTLYLLNLCSGSSYEIETDLARALTKGNPSDLDPDLRAQLIGEGIIVEDSVELEKLASILSDCHDAPIRSPDAFVIPTYECNLRCVYCFQHLHSEKTLMSLPVLRKALDIAEHRVTANAAVTLFGGEPLLPKNADFIGCFCEEIKRRKLRFRVISNGVALKQYKPMLAAYSGLLDYVQVTLDGPAPVHDQRRGQRSHERIMESISSCHDAIPITIRINTDFENIGSVPELVEEVHQRFENVEIYGAPVRDSIRRRTEAAAAEETKRRFLQTLLDLRDRYPRFSICGFKGLEIGESIARTSALPGPCLDFCAPKIVFDPKGLLFPCVSAAGRDELAIGEFWPDLSFRDNWWSNRIHPKGSKCHDCNLILACGGGCNLEQETGYVQICKQDVLRNIAASLEYFLERRRPQAQSERLCRE